MSSEHQQEVQYFTNESMKDLPFSEAVRVGNMLYLSGQIGIDSSMKLVAGGIAAETRLRRSVVWHRYHQATLRQASQSGRESRRLGKGRGAVRNGDHGRSRR